MTLTLLPVEHRELAIAGGQLIVSIWTRNGAVYHAAFPLLDTTDGHAARGMTVEDLERALKGTIFRGAVDPFADAGAIGSGTVACGRADD